MFYHLIFKTKLFTLFICWFILWVTVSSSAQRLLPILCFVVVPSSTLSQTWIFCMQIIQPTVLSLWQPLSSNFSFFTMYHIDDLLFPSSNRCMFYIYLGSNHIRKMFIKTDMYLVLNITSHIFSHGLYCKIVRLFSLTLAIIKGCVLQLEEYILPWRRNSILEHIYAYIHRN